jgi:GNAT superfamily N-acetyltransferase
MNIYTVTTKKLVREFYQFPVRLYADNPYWIRPLDDDIEKLFDRSKNELFEEGSKAIRWLAVDENNQTVGRIAAFVNQRIIDEGDSQVGGVGFFESVNSQKVANFLFDNAKQWLSENGCNAMDGPVNFGERDSWWGLLVSPFDLEPTYGMNYHLPYYQSLFENYGFHDYFQQYTYWSQLDEKYLRENVNRRIFGRAEKVYATEGYEFKHLDKNNLAKFSEDFRTIYNKAWGKNLVSGEMTKERAAQILKRMKPIMVPELLWFGYYEGEPIAFFFSLPELNQLFKHVNGKLNFIGKLKFLYYKLMRVNRKASGIIFGVVPEFQGKGVESAIGLALTRVSWRPGFQYQEIELNWIGDFNPKMLGVIRLLGVKKYKTYITYRYLFDQERPFKRFKFEK